MEWDGVRQIFIWSHCTWFGSLLLPRPIRLDQNVALVNKLASDTSHISKQWPCNPTLVTVTMQVPIATGIAASLHMYVCIAAIHIWDINAAPQTMTTMRPAPPHLQLEELIVDDNPRYHVP